MRAPGPPSDSPIRPIAEPMPRRLARGCTTSSASGGRLGVRRREVEVPDQIVAVDGEQMSGAVAGQLAQHLIADRSDTVVGARRGDQVTDPLLVGIGERPVPADRRH